MFGGIIKGKGAITRVEIRESFRVFDINVGKLVPNPEIGASVSVDGVCLTIARIEDAVLTFEVMEETLKLTTFTYLKPGDQVNIESPLRLGDEIGGHLVQGHVDGTAQILEIEKQGDNTRMRFWVGSPIGKYLIHKGSVAINGVSLTVCDPTTYPKVPEPSTAPRTYSFDVYLLPLTLERTTLGEKIASEKVNVEVDFLVKAAMDKASVTNQEIRV